VSNSLQLQLKAVCQKHVDINLFCLICCFCWIASI